MTVLDSEEVVSAMKGKYIDRLTDMYRRFGLNHVQVMELEKMIGDIAEYNYQVGYSHAMTPTGDWPAL